MPAVTLAEAEALIRAIILADAFAVHAIAHGETARVTLMRAYPGSPVRATCFSSCVSPEMRRAVGRVVDAARDCPELAERESEDPVAVMSVEVTSGTSATQRAAFRASAAHPQTLLANHRRAEAYLAAAA